MLTLETGAFSFIEPVYGLYVAMSIAMTVWVARTLHKNGRIFLVDAFHGNEKLADSVNHLLLVGFYLVNVGFISLFLKTADPPRSLRDAIELLSGKMGVVLLVLGGMHFLNIIVFSKLRRRAVLFDAPPPIPASERLA